MKTKNIKNILLAGFVGTCFAVSLNACVDNDDAMPENYYSSTKLTAAEF